MSFVQHQLQKALDILKKVWNYNNKTKFGTMVVILLILRNSIYMRLYRKYYKLAPGPNGIPFLGMIPYSRWLGPVIWHTKVVASYGKLASYPMGSQMFMMINDPTIARYVYQHKIARNRFEPFLDTVSNTITFLNGPIWYKRRKNIHSNLIAMLNTQFVTKGSIQFLQNVLFPFLDNKTEIDHIKPITAPLTFNLVLYGCIGHNLKSMKDPFFVAFDDKVQKFWKQMRLRIFVAWSIGQGKRYKLFLKQFLNLSRLGEDLRKEMVQLVIQFVKENGFRKIDDKRLCFYDLMKKSAEAHNQNDDNDNNDEDDDNNNTHLKLTDEEIYSDITSLLHPSVDTTANTLGFAILLLCKYPEIQQMIYEKELKILFQDDINNINLSQTNLQQLAYLRAFIHETMRIYPTTLFTAPHFIRNYDENETEEKIKIRIDETGEYYELPKQCHFAINIIGIHRNAKFWVKPDEDENIDMMKPHLKFWMDDNNRFKPHKSLFVFSFGKRECVGKQVAIKNLYVILSALVMRYKFSVKDPKNFIIPTNESNLFTPGPCKIMIQKRNSSL